jgi:hypothetical protein
MMKNVSRSLAVAAALVMIPAACTDVTLVPQGTVTSGVIFNDPASYQAYLAKIYGGLAVSGQQGPAGKGDINGIDEGFSQYIRLYWQMQELPTDEAIIAWNDAGVQELNTQLWGSSNQFLGAMYYRVLLQATLANDFLIQTSDEKLASRGVSATLKSTIQGYRAEARFLRALSYWHGMDLFGRIPLVTEADFGSTTPPQQATRQQIFDFIVSELNAVRPSLPAAGHGQYGRADQGAVDMLLANVYLNAEVYTGTARYSDARAAAEAVIASGAYSIDPSYRHLFQADNNTSPEMIFAVTQDGVRTQSYGGTTFLIHASVGGNMNASQYGIEGGWWGLRTRKEVATLYPSTSATPDRRAGVLVTDGQSLVINDMLNFQQGLGAPKYQNVTSTGQPGSNPAFADTDYPVFRLGEAYLIYAEAVVRGGGGTRTQALTYVNALRQRAYGNTSGNLTDAQLTLPLLLDERARELLWEGHRRQDLIRFGQFTGATRLWEWKGGVQQGRSTESFRNLFPLPSSELIANPNLTQNPGY